MTAEIATDAVPRINNPVPRRGVVITALGAAQILAWGSSYYLLAVLAEPIAGDTHWSLGWIVGGLSLGLLVQGLASPFVGDAIERRGGRPVLALSAILLACGLIGLAVAPSLPFYVAAWLVVGLGMSAGLYDAAFSTLGRLYGHAARQAITLLTLLGGFASTVCWPLTAFLSEELGWRGACLVYAAIQLAIALPLYLIFVPSETQRSPFKPPAEEIPDSAGQMVRTSRRRRVAFLLLATTFALATSIAAVVSVHLITLLMARDVTLAAAVTLGALIGPAQVGARIVDMVIGRNYHPVWAMVASAGLIALGVGLLWLDLPAVSIALVLYGGGMGIKSIVRGTIPLLVFGIEGYASTMGRLAMPSLIAGAGAPFLGAMLIERYGADTTLAVLTTVALINVALVGVLVAQLRHSERGG